MILLTYRDPQPTPSPTHLSCFFHYSQSLPSRDTLPTPPHPTSTSHICFVHAQSEADSSSGSLGVPTVLDAAAVGVDRAQASVAEYVRYVMASDRKLSPMKSLQVRTHLSHVSCLVSVFILRFASCVPVRVLRIFRGCCIFSVFNLSVNTGNACLFIASQDDSGYIFGPCIIPYFSCQSDRRSGTFADVVEVEMYLIFPIILMCLWETWRQCCAAGGCGHVCVIPASIGGGYESYLFTTL